MNVKYYIAIGDTSSEGFIYRKIPGKEIMEMFTGLQTITKWCDSIWCGVKNGLLVESNYVKQKRDMIVKVKRIPEKEVFLKFL